MAGVKVLQQGFHLGVLDVMPIVGGIRATSGNRMPRLIRRMRRASRLFLSLSSNGIGVVSASGGSIAGLSVSGSFDEEDEADGGRGGIGWMVEELPDEPAVEGLVVNGEA